MPVESIYISYTNEELFSLLSQDNEQAFTELYNRFWETLFAIAYNRLKDEQAAEDILHDLFAVLWRNRHTLEPASLKNYLAASVKYLVLAQIRKKEQARQYEIYQLHKAAPETGAEESLHYRRIIQMMQEEVNQLPEKCRLVFKWSRERGMTTKEIAQSLHISPKTVDNHLNKALTHLKLKMKHLLTSFFLLP